jgi:rubrerythrin
MLPLGTYLLALALVLVLGLVIALPLFDRKRPAVKPPSRRESLERERQDIIRAIRELDFDHRTGKINDEDYKIIRDSHVQRGAQVLRDLNALEEVDIDEVIETKVAALRKTRDEAEDNHCPKCNALVSEADKFCPQCGHALKPSRQPAAT